MIIAFFLILLFIFPLFFALAIKLSGGKNVGKTIYYLLVFGLAFFFFILDIPIASFFVLIVPIFIKIIGWSLKVLFE